MKAIRSMPYRIRHWWRTLWIRKDEFHVSLELDDEYMMFLDQKQRDTYIKDLFRRREIACRRDSNRR